eukprot:CAMPEP_0113606736 /NCGR_PEP_ID=MMETSP0017_2-20120614/3014_1 /TAXON_ID=2856 /ORGANISM="Cylindrotheca closterium" /LENGTH=202 /DNA_ID=CAMNT_0000515301 /DNA_START=32 /DNA_END=640 /DNA_ORIENTATION=- /assembly_acc=CAM_ASM_000147
MTLMEIPMEDDQQAQAQSMPSPLPSEPFGARQRANWDAVTPFIPDAPPPRSPPFRMRPRPKPSDILECRPNDIERLSLPVLTKEDLTKAPLAPPPLPLNIIPPRRRPTTEFSRSLCGKRTRPTEKRFENPIFKSATLQYPGISGKTIYADPLTRAKEITDDTITTSCGDNKKHLVDEDFYFPMPRFTQATRSALPHVLQLSD